jgi:ATP-binding cassette subfamily C (CFTR/MRP) protein 1
MRLLAPFVTFVAFVLIQGHIKLELTPAKAFTTLSLIGLLSSPFNTLLRAIPALKSALACFGRIQNFLVSPSRQPHVLRLNAPTDADGCLSGHELSINTTYLDLVTDENIELVNLTPQMGNFSHPIMIDVRNASFAWTVGGPPIIHDVSCSVLRNSFVFVIGPVGCGKSTLLKGLMSETPSSRGFVYCSSSGISFVDQTPWIQNTTIQQNIIGPAILDEEWYREVVRACCLDHDIAALSNSHGILVPALAKVSKKQGELTLDQTASLAVRESL